MSSESIHSIKTQLHQTSLSSSDEDIRRITGAARETIRNLETRVADLEQAARHALSPHGNQHGLTSLKHTIESPSLNKRSLFVSRLWLAGLGHAYHRLLKLAPNTHHDPDDHAMLEQLESYLGESVRECASHDTPTMIYSPWKTIAKQLADHVENHLPIIDQHDDSLLLSLLECIRHDHPSVTYHDSLQCLNPLAFTPEIGATRRERLAAHVLQVTSLMQQANDSRTKAFSEALKIAIDNYLSTPVLVARVAHCLTSGERTTVVMNMSTDDARLLMEHASFQEAWIHPK